MKILGLDPGSHITGFGVITPNHTLVGCGCLHATGPLTQRLQQLYQGLTGIIQHFAPTTLAIETIFSGCNPCSALILGHARGVLLLAAQEAGLNIFEYHPKSIKHHLTGAGGAHKGAVAQAVLTCLRCTFHLPVDATDALAAAITCGAQSNGLMQ